MNLTNIASLLAGSWSVQPDGNSIRRSDGLALWFREGGYNNEHRIAISFDRPRGIKGDYINVWLDDGGKLEDPKISVARTKSDEAIVKDIVRRLLPDCEVAFKLVNVRIDSERKHSDARDESLKRVCEILGAESKKSSRTGESSYEVDPYVGIASFGKNGYGKVTVNSGGSVDLVLNSMSIAFAEKILKAVADVVTAERERAK